MFENCTQFVMCDIKSLKKKGEINKPLRINAYCCFKYNLLGVRGTLQGIFHNYLTYYLKNDLLRNLLAD